MRFTDVLTVPGRAETAVKKRRRAPATTRSTGVEYRVASAETRTVLAIEEVGERQCNRVSPNTNAASIMIGEKAAEMLAADHSVKLDEFVGDTAAFQQASAFAGRPRGGIVDQPDDLARRCHDRRRLHATGTKIGLCEICSPVFLRTRRRRPEGWNCCGRGDTPLPPHPLTNCCNTIA
jgi:hypothetical protein